MNYYNSDVLKRLSESIFDNMQLANDLMLDEEEFKTLYDLPNRPTIITKAMEDWEAMNLTLDNINEK